VSTYIARALISMMAAAPAFCQVGIPPIKPPAPIISPIPNPILPPPTLPGLPATDPLVIASIGDSNAAGEGVPNATGSAPSIWTLAQCHRSENSGRTLAANALAPLTDLEYTNVACSGGSINVGLQGPYVGMPVNGTFGNAMPAQVQQVKDWMNQNLRRRNLDVLIISIGVNDAGFGHVVGACLDPLSGAPNHTGNCAANQDLIELLANGDPDNATVTLGLNRLGGALDQLADTVKRELNPRYVLITEYPNPVHDEKGFFCNSYDEHFEVLPSHIVSGNLVPTTGILHWLAVGGAMKNVHDYESDFMESSLINPLNSALKQAAQRHSADGWRYVGGMVEMTRPHGFCAAEPWVNTLKASFQKQGDLNGTAHLNKAGQKAYQYLLQKKIVELFNLASAPPVEMFGNQVTREYIADKKRIVIEVSPTVHIVEGEIQYKLRTTDQAAMIQALSVPLIRDTSFNVRQVYYADLPGTETLTYGESFHYRPVIRYGRQQSFLNGLIVGQVREYTVFRYQEISSN